MSRHPELPHDGFIVCHICAAHIEKEENEISRHYRGAHGDTHPHFKGNTPYALCRIVPEDAAVDLAGQARVDTLKGRDGYTHINYHPKAPFASIADIIGMYARRGLPYPAVVFANNQPWPPVGGAQQAGPAASALAHAPAPAAPPFQHGPTQMFQAAVPGYLPASLPVARPAIGHNQAEEDEDADEESEGELNDTLIAGDAQDEYEVEEADGRTHHPSSDYVPSSPQDAEMDDAPALNSESDEEQDTDLGAIQTGPGQLPAVADPSAKPDEADYLCHVHYRAELEFAVIRGNFATMWDHFNQWHPEVLREAFQREYVARYEESHGGLDDGALVTGMEMGCFECADWVAEDFEALEVHFRLHHRQARFNMAMEIFLGWAAGQDL